MKRSGRKPDWVTVRDAVERVLSAVRPLDSEDVPLLEALGRTTAEDVVSSIDQPPWDNSAMDGYAARCADVRGAARDRPVTLRVIESVPAGGFPTRAVGTGQATRIMTGAPLPEGADSVIRIEHTEDARDGSVKVLNDMDAGRNVRARGEDLRRGVVAVRSGTQLRAGEIGVLATIGCASPRVHRRPRVAILATGDELVDVDGFDAVRAGKRIVNSNSYALAAAVLATGALPVPLGIARDDAASLREHLARGREADALVITAGASVGDHDLVKDALDEAGVHVDFWRVHMRPGSPFSFGTLVRPPREPLPVFNLPGNPVSALVTFEVLVRPALRRMLGRRALHSRTVTVRAAQRIESKRGLVHFLRVRLESDRRGPPVAALTGPQGSGLMTSVARADALLVVPLDSEGIDEGDEATAILLAPGDDAQQEPGYEI